MNSLLYSLLTNDDALLNELTLRSTLDQESATLGSELLSASGWTSTGWTGSYATGWTHTAGNTTALSNTLAAVSNTNYLITHTITGRTAGFCTLTFGGNSWIGSGFTGLTSTGNVSFRANSTANLTFTPTTDFDGTVVLSVKAITLIQSSLFTMDDSTGVNSFEIRNYDFDSNNAAVGTLAGSNMTTGLRNALFGAYAGEKLSSGTTNTFIGYQAGRYASGSADNTYIGSSAGINTTTGSSNTCMGAAAGQNITNSNRNTFIGRTSGGSTTTGIYNSAVGWDSLFSNATGANNVAVGSQTLFSSIGNSNSALGYASGYSHTGGLSSFFGYNAGRYLADGTTAKTTGDNETYIGTNTKASANGLTNENVFGYNATGSGSNTVTYGDSAITNHVFKAGKITNNDLVTTQAKATVADDGTITLAAGATGFLNVWTDAEYMQVYIDGSAVVTSVYGSANTAITDTDTKLCVYDGGASAIIKNRLGSSKSVGYVFTTI